MTTTQTTRGPGGKLVGKAADDPVMILRSAANTSPKYHPYKARYLHEVMEIERAGVPAQAFLRTTEKLKLPSSRVFQIFNIPKSTAAHKIKMGTRFEGTEALASLRLEKLLALAEAITSNSLHPDAKKFDSGKWLGEWIESHSRRWVASNLPRCLIPKQGGNVFIRCLPLLKVVHTNDGGKAGQTR